MSSHALVPNTDTNKQKLSEYIHCESFILCGRAPLIKLINKKPPTKVTRIFLDMI